MTPDWFCSDHHFCHENVIRYSNRPFSSAEEMNKELIYRHNYLVRPSDLVLFLGDFALGTVEQAADTLAQLNGRKILVRGNHDRSAAAMARIGFEVVVDSLTMHIKGRTVRAYHRPYPGTPSAEVAPDQKLKPEAPMRHSGDVLLHGHTHSTSRVNGNQIHVGVDAWGYFPASRHQVEGLCSVPKHPSP